MKNRKSIRNILDSRQALRPAEFDGAIVAEQPAEGGCGVIGIACSEQIAGRHMLQSLDQMKNRGNGKGGGIAAVGLVPEEYGVTQEILDNDYLLAVAYLEPGCREEVEAKHIFSTFEVDHVRFAPQLEDYRAIEGLEIRPPDVYQYFVRVKPAVLASFREEHRLELSQREIEDEIVFQNSFRLNSEYYAATGETRAFVLSHGKNLLVLKMVGYGDDVIRYYQLEDVHAHVWIGHHRYPTKGRVWHPGGAHPFVGLNEALVHNGDFANYASIGEYLAQRNIYPHFLTDTEVSVQVFDLLYRTYGYPLEYVIEALAPTTERDFAMLPPEKQQIYKMLQVTHMHCSPDGPWFFLIAQSDVEEGEPAYRLTGITDTSMLRPQVFAWQQASDEGPAIGFAASEKQAIDAALASLAAHDGRFWSRADRYWNARGGSHTDGGAFIFTATPRGNGSASLSCTDKFGRPVTVDVSSQPYRANGSPVHPLPFPDLPAVELFDWAKDHLVDWSYDEFQGFLKALVETADADESRERAVDVISQLMDRRYPTGSLRRSSLSSLLDESFLNLAACMRRNPTRGYVYFGLEESQDRDALECQTAVIDARGYPSEGPKSAAPQIVNLWKRGFQKFLVINAGGHRFIGNGFGSQSHEVRIDVYGSSGDYLASGIDGIEIHVHGNAQDQLAQIMKSGKLVVYGDVGQTFGYAAKGGEAYIMGNAAGRPLINAVGKPRVVINGTCLDYLAESFMAGDPLNGGGFAVLNGVTLTDDGRVEDLSTPYPGGNLFSLASGGAIYVRDPRQLVTVDQLNGGAFYPFRDQEWQLILPHLRENERLFGIKVNDLLKVNGEKKDPAEVYRKIAPA